jgi:hypothetical protein
LLQGRYLDENGQPLAASAAATSTSGPFAEFKQIFVYMKFVMDQRKVPDLLSVCANSELPIEVRQVRVRPLGGVGPAGGGGVFGGFGGGMGGGGGMAAGNVGELALTDYDMLVEVSGIIYLYNPPIKENLGKGTAKNPEKRSFGLPTGSVTAPRGARGRR